MIIAKRINIYRNILPYKFVHKETASNLKIIEEKIIDHLIKYDFTVSCKEINKKQFKLLKHKFSDIEIIINYINHITITVSDFSDDDPYQLYLKGREIEEKIKGKFNLAFSKKFGYLTPYFNYTPHGVDLDVIISLFFCKKHNHKDKIIENIKMEGYEVKYEFLPLDYIISIKMTPIPGQNLKDFITKSYSLLKTLEKEEENNFNNYLLKSKIIFIDMIKKIKGYILNSAYLSYKESVESLTLMLYYKLINKGANEVKDNLGCKKVIFCIENSNSINAMRKNSKTIKSIVKDET